MRNIDVLIIGAGPGGLAAACSAKKAGASSVVVLERDRKAGGILNQCIHDGFGLIRYNAELTGPEYKQIYMHGKAACSNAGRPSYGNLLFLRGHALGKL